jgi:hypothetical protein
LEGGGGDYLSAANGQKVYCSCFCVWTTNNNTFSPFHFFKSSKKKRLELQTGAPFDCYFSAKLCLSCVVVVKKFVYGEEKEMRLWQHFVTQ